ncbi:MAG: 16S rRNA processing protein RimM [Ferrovum sp. 34-44-207]|uniref:ribosome maturation factor RimM n=1 Tax=Ferrovum sp. JA12 TaxID=1356299 RepID=UPI000702803F|nr:ribosome maturation factor RimM [Ferrovum sp. JA12]KRH79295.1 ribosome maturation factor RimM [Ferrovum sp. JA12]OZB34081.1 MAG: 16S rRNA processing protein RimM [Ferrovum sp. 34-44-207]
MGRIGAPYGVKGGFHVVAFTEDVNSLTQFSAWWIGSEDNCHEESVAECRVHGNGLVARLHSIADRDRIALERGQLILIPRQLLPEPDEDELYWTDMIGLNVYNIEGQPLGQVTRLLETGAQDLLVVRQAQTERLIPFVEPIVIEVNVAQQRIVVDWGVDY